MIMGFRVAAMSASFPYIHYFYPDRLHMIYYNPIMYREYTQWVAMMNHSNGGNSEWAQIPGPTRRDVRIAYHYWQPLRKVRRRGNSAKSDGYIWLHNLASK